MLDINTALTTHGIHNTIEMQMFETEHDTEFIKVFVVFHDAVDLEKGHSHVGKTTVMLSDPSNFEIFLLPKIFVNVFNFFFSDNGQFLSSFFSYYKVILMIFFLILFYFFKLI